MRNSFIALDHCPFALDVKRLCIRLDFGDPAAKPAGDDGPSLSNWPGFAYTNAAVILGFSTIPRHRFTNVSSSRCSSSSFAKSWAKVKLETERCVDSVWRNRRAPMSSMYSLTSAPPGMTRA